MALVAPQLDPEIGLARSTVHRVMTLFELQPSPFRSVDQHAQVERILFTSSRRPVKRLAKVRPTLAASY
jgi:hypothetical protein